MFTFLGSEKPLGIIRLAGNWILLRALALCFAANSRQSSEKKSGLIYYFFRKTTTELPESIYPLSSVVLCVYSDQLIVPAFPVSVLTFRFNHLLPFYSFRYGSLWLKTLSSCVSSCLCQVVSVSRVVVIRLRLHRLLPRLHRRHGASVVVVVRLCQRFTGASRRFIVR